MGSAALWQSRCRGCALLASPAGLSWQSCGSSAPCAVAAICAESRSMGSGGRGKGKRGGEVPRDVRISKALTQVLRHKAIDLGLSIRPDGFVRMQDLLECKFLSKMGTTVADVEQITLNSDKQRFEIVHDSGELFIRAVQGHSIKIVQDGDLLRPLTMEDQDLPEECVHGTYRRHLSAILQNGLIAGGKLGKTFRNHVHFAPYTMGDTRVVSGMRYDSEVAIWINLREGLRRGIPFFVSKNKVILSPGLDGVVPPELFVKVFDMQKRQAVEMHKPEARDFNEEESKADTVSGNEDKIDVLASSQDKDKVDAMSGQAFKVLRWCLELWRGLLGWPAETKPSPDLAS